MDLTRPIVYRDFALNDPTITPGPGLGTGITGCVVDSVDISDVDVVQFLEKRSLQDGMDAGDVYLGARRVRMAGTLYGRNRAELYDSLQELRAAMSPTLAQREEPGDKGYRPLYYTVPTNRVEDYPAGVIDQRILVLPRALQALVQRDQTGGDDGDALAIPWQATFVQRDPRIMGETPQDYEFVDTVVVTGATAAAATDLITKTTHGLIADTRLYATALTGGAGLVLGTPYYVLASGLTANSFKVSATIGGTAINITTDATVLSYTPVVTNSGSLLNRGDYHAPVNMLLQVGTQAGTIVISAGSANMTITVPASAATRIIRYKGEDKVLSVEENEVEVLAMNWMTFQNNTTHPLVVGGDSPYTVTFTGVVLLTGSHLWFWESFA